MGQTVLDSYIVESLMPDLVGHDRLPSAFLVYLFLWHEAGRTSRLTVEMSHRAIAEGTGLSKRIVQTAIHHLIRRKLLIADRASITAIPRYTIGRPWIRRTGS